VRLFHFSDDPGITRFVPRSVQVPSERGPGTEWLNGPLVWAIDDWHQPMYLFPRDCPRILIWGTAQCTRTDKERWLGESDARIVAHIEQTWFETVQRAVVERYELPSEDFESLDDAGMWVSRTDVMPLARLTLQDLPSALRDQNVELRVLESLSPLRDAWSSSLHVSGIRLRNARNWHV
jgi:uncharacterized protein DUF6886